MEYARNVISIMWGTNRVGELHFGDKSVRSLERRPSLWWKTFSDISPVKIQEQTVGVFTVDTDRIETVMKACVCALHFHEMGERIRDWEIVLPNLHLPNNATDEASTAWDQRLSLFRQLRFGVKTTASPGVFEYAIAEMEGGIAYALRFYENFLVYALAAMKSESHPSA